MPKCQCAGNACNCNITAGDGLTVTGTGNASSPFVLSLASQLIQTTVTVAGPVDLSGIGTGGVAYFDLSANVTGLTFPSTVGTRFEIVTKHTVGATSLTWPVGQIKWAAATPPTQSSTAGRYDWFAFRLVAAGVWVGTAEALNAG